VKDLSALFLTNQLACHTVWMLAQYKTPLSETKDFIFHCTATIPRVLHIIQVPWGSMEAVSNECCASPQRNPKCRHSRLLWGGRGRELQTELPSLRRKGDVLLHRTADNVCCHEGDALCLPRLFACIPEKVPKLSPVLTYGEMSPNNLLLSPSLLCWPHCPLETQPPS
jgi:hypothetical protein